MPAAVPADADICTVITDLLYDGERSAGHLKAVFG